MTALTHRLDDYDYHLPLDRIAQFPAPKRDQSRLLVLETTANELAHRRFSDLLDYLRPGDLLVVNNTKVFPARLLGHKQTGGRVELFLLAYPEPEPLADQEAKWHSATAPALIKSSKRPRSGDLLHFGETLQAQVLTLHKNGKATVRLLYRPEAKGSLDLALHDHGQIPLPPYINRPGGSSPEDGRRYQTRYARHTGSVAAPTAGLHFSDEMLASIAGRGVEIATILLHVGYGTFAPVRSEDIREHTIHKEMLEIATQTATMVNRIKQRGGRIWAVGTTTVRALEFAAGQDGSIKSLRDECGLYIYPGFRFRVVDNLITNFHLPKSSLLFLVSALAGRERILEAYRVAVAERYRFFSYGDAMAIITKP